MVEKVGWKSHINHEEERTVRDDRNEDEKEASDGSDEVSGSA